MTRNAKNALLRPIERQKCIILFHSTYVRQASRPIFLSPLLLRAKIEEEHSKQYQEKIDKLSLEVLLVKDGGSEEEADDDTASAHHAYDTDHRTWQTQRIEIYEVGCTEEDADEDDGPMPAE